MSKAYSEADLSDQITRDRNWRIKEISDLKTAVQRADIGLQKALLRAIITLCYAHWEGSVRFSATKYMEHIALRKLRYNQLDRQFLRNYFLPRLASLSITKISLLERCDLLDDILGAENRRFSRVNEDLINTKSNLNSDVLRDICLVCGIAYDIFSDTETFIDVILLKRRNQIAHGEDTLISVEDLDPVTDQTISLMRNFGDALENRIYEQRYRASQAIPLPSAGVPTSPSPGI